MSGDDRWASPWSCDAFRSMHLSLVRSKAATEQLEPEERETALASFQPLFVHQLFGESEVVVRAIPSLYPLNLGADCGCSSTVRLSQAQH